MAAKQHTALAPVGATKTCTQCGETKPLEDFFRNNKGADGHDHRCKPCKKKYAAQYREKNLEKCRQQSRENMRKFLQTEEGREINRRRAAEYKARNRARYLELKKAQSARRRDRQKAQFGIYDAHVMDWKKRQLKLKKRSVKHDAHIVDFIAFKKTASNGWHARHWKRIGQPWRNPRLSKAQRYRIRYRLDTAFRLQEINRQTWRKETLAERDDGTINFWALLKERKTCPYCGCRITKENAVADHMDPLKHGGNNSQSNLTICCRSCNVKKSGRPFTEWLVMLPVNRRAAASRWYIRKHGHAPQQQSLTFAFANEP